MVGERFTLALRTRLLSHLQRLEPDALDRRRHGDVLARLTGDVHAIETLLLSAVAELVQALARLVFFAGALCLLSWKLALASLVVVPLFYFAARRFARLARRAARERRRRSGSLTAVAEESLANTALVQSANAQEQELERFRRENKGAMAAELAGTRIAGLFAPMIDLIELAGAIIIIVLGTWALSAGELTIGGLLAFLAYLSQLYRPMRDLSRLGQRVFEATAGAERVLELLDLEPRVTDRPHARALERAHGQLELERVSYAYPGSERPALDGVSLLVRPGRCVAVVGASGAGKSTLAKLVLRFTDPDQGVVRLDGHDLRDVTLHSLRENVALLLQEAPLFDGTVRETSPTACRTRPRSRSPPPWRRRRPPVSPTRCPTASARARASAGARSPAASAAAWRWPARCCRTRRSSCSTNPRRGSTRAPRVTSSSRCGA